MKIYVLDSLTLGEDLSFEPLYSVGEVKIFENTSKEELISRIADPEVIVINKVKITKEVLQAAKKLKLICICATGYDNIDVKEAARLGIAVANVPAYSTDSVALFTVANVLALFTHLKEYNSYVVSGKYSASGVANALSPIYHELRGKVWGIVGFGNIGRAVGNIARAFGAEVIVNKRLKVDDFECVDIDTLCKRSDIITLHCPLTNKTRGIINEDRLKLMKKSVVLVNEARGAVVDENAVANAVIRGEIGAFGSDVYSVEPFSTEHPFYKIKDMANVCFTPHAAWGAYEARVRCLNVVCENIKAFKRGEIKNRIDISGQK